MERIERVKQQLEWVLEDLSKATDDCEKSFFSGQVEALEFVLILLGDKNANRHT